MLSYSTNHVGLPRNDRVEVRLHGTERVGARGHWVGRVPRSAAKLSFPMEREDGEWRIAHPPDALILPQTFYDQNFQDASLYYFDPTGRILVPEPVHVPQGSQLASSLVRTLLRYLLAMTLAMSARAHEDRGDPVLLELVRGLDRRKLGVDDYS